MVFIVNFILTFKHNWRKNNFLNIKVHQLFFRVIMKFWHFSSFLTCISEYKLSKHHLQTINIINFKPNTHLYILCVCVEKNIYQYYVNSTTQFVWILFIKIVIFTLNSTDPWHNVRGWHYIYTTVCVHTTTKILKLSYSNTRNAIFIFCFADYFFFQRITK